MMEHLFFILSISLFDSLATTQQIIVFVLMFTTVKPLRNALSYLAGLLSSYYLFGLLGYKGLDHLKTILKVLMPSSDKMPDSTYYTTQLFVGIVFIVVGYVYYIKKTKTISEPAMENIIISKLKNMSMLLAFGVGILISITSFPFSVPYIITLGKLTTFNISFTTVSSYLLLYNFGYALPMLVVLGIYLFMRHGIDDIEDSLHNKAKMLNIKLTTWVFVGMGFLSIIDSACYMDIKDYKMMLANNEWIILHKGNKKFQSNNKNKSAQTNTILCYP